MEINSQALSGNMYYAVAYEDGETIVEGISALGDDIQAGKSLAVVEQDLVDLASALSDMESIVTTSNGFTQKQVDTFTSELEGTTKEILNPKLSAGEDAAQYWMAHAFNLGVDYFFSLDDDDDFNKTIGQ